MAPAPQTSNTSARLGWVMVCRKSNFILDFTFATLQRHAIQSIWDVYPNWTRKQILEEWRPERALQTTSLVQS